MSVTKERRKSYTCHFKIEVVDYAETYSNGRAADHYGVHRRRVQEWRNQKPKLVDQIKQAKGNTKRLSGGGRKHDHSMTLTKLKDKMTSWIQNRLEVGVKLNSKTVFEEAYRFNHNVTLKWADNLLEEIELDLLEQGLDNNEYVYIEHDREEVIIPQERKHYSNLEKKALISRALSLKTYTIHDWLDGNTGNDAMQFKYSV